MFGRVLGRLLRILVLAAVMAVAYAAFFLPVKAESALQAVFAQAFDGAEVTVKVRQFNPLALLWQEAQGITVSAVFLEDADAQFTSMELDYEGAGALRALAGGRVSETAPAGARVVFSSEQVDRFFDSAQNMFEEMQILHEGGRVTLRGEAMLRGRPLELEASYTPSVDSAGRVVFSADSVSAPGLSAGLMTALGEGFGDFIWSPQGVFSDLGLSAAAAVILPDGGLSVTMVNKPVK